MISAPLGRMADPGWIGWNTPDQFRTLLKDADHARLLDPAAGVRPRRWPEGVLSLTRPESNRRPATEAAPAVC